VGHGPFLAADHVSAHIAVWYLIAGVVFGAKPLSEKVSRMAFLLYILFLQLASAHHLLADPASARNGKSSTQLCHVLACWRA